jgi:hypothetical protein
MPHLDTNGRGDQDFEVINGAETFWLTKPLGD